MAIGAIGLIVPLLVVLFVADFLVFADLEKWDVTLPLLVSIAALPLGILLDIALGVLNRAFAGRDLLKVSLLLLGSIALLLAFVWGATAVHEKKAQVEAELALAVEGLWAPGEQSKAFSKLTRDVADRPGQADGRARPGRHRLLRGWHSLRHAQPGHRPGASPARPFRPHRLHVHGLGRRVPGLQHQQPHAPGGPGR